MTVDSDLQIEVAGFHCAWTVSLPAGATIRDAVEKSGAMAHSTEFSWERVGIYGRIRDPDTPLQNGDRVEIYRPLQCLPRQARRLRAVRQSGRDRSK